MDFECGRPCGVLQIENAAELPGNIGIQIDRSYISDADMVSVSGYKLNLLETRHVKLTQYDWVDRVMLPPAKYNGQRLINTSLYVANRCCRPMIFFADHHVVVEFIANGRKRIVM